MFVIVLALLSWACTADTAEKRTSGAGADAPNGPVRTPSPVQAGSNPAPSPSTDSGAGAAAELRRLAAARQMIHLEHSDAEEADAGEFEAGGAEPPLGYAGEYHFGDSESESTLTLSVQGNAVTGNFGYADWENERWVPKEVRFDSGRIERGKLTAPGWSGIFASYRGQPGLIILRAPTERLQIEFGERISGGIISP
jgi:hypothetical protein